MSNNSAKVTRQLERLRLIIISESSLTDACTVVFLGVIPPLLASHPFGVHLDRRGFHIFMGATNQILIDVYVK